MELKKNNEKVTENTEIILVTKEELLEGNYPELTKMMCLDCEDYEKKHDILNDEFYADPDYIKWCGDYVSFVEYLTEDASLLYIVFNVEDREEDNIDQYRELLEDFYAGKLHNIGGNWDVADTIQFGIVYRGGMGYGYDLYKAGYIDLN